MRKNRHLKAEVLNEWNEKLDDVYKKIDWDIVNKHRKSPGARKQYEIAKEDVKSFFRSVIERTAENMQAPDLDFYQKKFYRIRKKNPTPNHLPKLQMILNGGIGWKTGILLFGTGVVFGLSSGYVLAANKKGSVSAD